MNSSDYDIEPTPTDTTDGARTPDPATETGTSAGRAETDASGTEQH